MGQQGRDFTMTRDTDQARQRRGIALIIAGVGVVWIIATTLGAYLDWSQRTRALFDLAALAGFGVAIWKLVGQLRARNEDKD